MHQCNYNKKGVCTLCGSELPRGYSGAIEDDDIKHSRKALTTNRNKLVAEPEAENRNGEAGGPRSVSSTRVPGLSADQEANLCRIIRRQKVEEGIRDPDSATIEAGKTARELLIASHHGLLVKLVQSFSNEQDTGREFDHLYGLACEGIIRATESFDAERGRFSTHARIWIEKMLKGAVGSSEHTEMAWLTAHGLSGMTVDGGPPPCGRRTELAACIERTGHTTQSIADELAVSERSVRRWCSGTAVPGSRYQSTLNLLFDRVKRGELFAPAEEPAASNKWKPPTFAELDEWMAEQQRKRLEEGYVDPLWRDFEEKPSTATTIDDEDGSGIGDGGYFDHTDLMNMGAATEREPDY